MHGVPVQLPTLLAELLPRPVKTATIDPNHRGNGFLLPGYPWLASVAKTIALDQHVALSQKRPTVARCLTKLLSHGDKPVYHGAQQWALAFYPEKDLPVPTALGVLFSGRRFRWRLCRAGQQFAAGSAGPCKNLTVEYDGMAGADLRPVPRRQVHDSSIVIAPVGH